MPAQATRRSAWKNISCNYIQIHSSTRRPHSGPPCIHLPADATQTQEPPVAWTSNTQPSQLGVALIACTSEGRLVSLSQPHNHLKGDSLGPKVACVGGGGGVGGAGHTVGAPSAPGPRGGDSSCGGVLCSVEGHRVRDR